MIDAIWRIAAISGANVLCNAGVAALIWAGSPREPCCTCRLAGTDILSLRAVALRLPWLHCWYVRDIAIRKQRYHASGLSSMARAVPLCPSTPPSM